MRRKTSILAIIRAFESRVKAWGHESLDESLAETSEYVFPFTPRARISNSSILCEMKIY
jgi:hypothetical protein